MILSTGGGGAHYAWPAVPHPMYAKCKVFAN